MEYYVVHNSLIPMGQLSEVLILLRQDHTTGKIQMAEPLKWKDTSEAADFANNEAFILANAGIGAGQISWEIRDFLQAMADAAWKLGIKPREAVDSASELKAVRYHLEDMRIMARLVQAPLPPPTPLKSVG